MTPKEAIIKKIKEELSMQYQPTKLVLFGSATSKGLEQANDIDLCVIKNGFKDKSEEFVKIRKILGRTIVPLDVLIFNQEEFNRRKDIWGTVQYEIDKNGEVLYESK
ncbi:MAG: nucleotidyltransferase domain-containing protein [bacterium]